MRDLAAKQPQEISWDGDWFAWMVRVGAIKCNVSIEDLALCEPNSLAYLATPYSKLVAPEGCWSPEISALCGETAALWGGLLATYDVTSIVVENQINSMVRMIGVECLDPLDDGFWSQYCAVFMSACDILVIPPIEGWRESAGIWAEVRAAIEGGKFVYLLADFC